MRRRAAADRDTSRPPLCGAPQAALDVAGVRRFGASLALDANATKMDMPFRSVDQEVRADCRGWRAG